jgi:hypothetical protein
MTHHIDAIEQWHQRGGITYVEQLTVRRRCGGGAVRGGKHRVDGDDVVPRVA